MPLPPSFPARGLLVGLLALLGSNLAGPAVGSPPRPAPYRPPHAAPTVDSLAARNAALLRAAKAGGAAAEPGAKDGAHGDAAATSDRYDVRRYALDLAIDPAAETVAGSVALVFASVVDSLREVVLDLTDALTVSAIEHADGSLAYSHAGDSLVVALPEPLPAGTVDSLTVFYGGRPPEPATDRGLMFK
jgi:hypothetical protein